MFGRSKVQFLSGTQSFFFVPRSWHIDQFTFHISFPSLKFTIFIPYHVLGSCSCLFVCFFRKDKKKKIGKKLLVIPRVLVAHWIERPPTSFSGLFPPTFKGKALGTRLSARPSFWGVMGSIPFESGFFSVPRSCPVDQCAFHISLMSCHLYSFIFPKNFDYHRWTTHWQQLISVIFSFPFAIIFSALIINTRILSNLVKLTPRMVYIRLSILFSLHLTMMTGSHRNVVLNFFRQFVSSNSIVTSF